MKYIILLACLFFVIKNSATEITLAEAVKNKHVECVITGNPNGTHYSKPLIIKLKNLKTEVAIKIDNGQIFNAVDTSYQDIVVTLGLMAYLKPGESKTYVIQGMCIESSNSAPGESVAYKIGPNADEKLCKLTKFIQEKKYFNQTAQQAVWVMRGQRNINRISGFDADGWEDIVKFTASLLNVPVPERPKEDDYERNYDTYPSKLTMSGSFEIDWPMKSKATVGMFNKQGIIVRELYNNPELPPGRHKIDFEFDASYFDDPAYDFKMIINGEVFIEQEIKILRR